MSNLIAGLAERTMVFVFTLGGAFSMSEYQHLNLTKRVARSSIWDWGWFDSCHLYIISLHVRLTFLTYPFHLIEKTRIPFFQSGFSLFNWSFFEKFQILLRFCYDFKLEHEKSLISKASSVKWCHHPEMRISVFLGVSYDKKFKKQAF